jgi:uncharacterized protein (DUF433 family)
MVNWKEYINIDPSIQNGKPIVKYTRITVELILDKLAEGETVDQILVSHPRLTKEAIFAAIAYAADSLKNEITYSIAS